MGEILVGTCGYGYYEAPEDLQGNHETKRAAFTHDFDLLEVQKTFYGLPRTQTCERWRERASEGFTFTMKAWQALTHTLRSPTWRGNDDGLSPEQMEHFGSLRPNEYVREAWNGTLERARALRAPVIVLQCPPSFEPTPRNESNLRELLSGVDREGVRVALELRGDWLDLEDRVASICRDLGLIHVVDLPRRRPGHLGDVAYVRLHGLNRDPYDYNDHYSAEDSTTWRIGWRSFVRGPSGSFVCSTISVNSATPGS